LYSDAVCVCTFVEYGSAGGRLLVPFAGRPHSTVGSVADLLRTTCFLSPSRERTDGSDAFAMFLSVDLSATGLSKEAEFHVQVRQLLHSTFIIFADGESILCTQQDNGPIPVYALAQSRFFHGACCWSIAQDISDRASRSSSANSGTLTSSNRAGPTSLRPAAHW
jgi:hypothetical protein